MDQAISKPDHQRVPCNLINCHLTWNIFEPYLLQLIIFLNVPNSQLQILPNCKQKLRVGVDIEEDSSLFVHPVLALDYLLRLMTLKHEVPDKLYANPTCFLFLVFECLLKLLFILFLADLFIAKFHVGVIGMISSFIDVAAHFLRFL